MKLGCHVSFNAEEQLLGSARSASNYGANCFMFYTGAPQNTLRKEINEEQTKEAWKFMKEHNIDINDVICHAPYIINLANRKEETKWQFSVDFLKQELVRCEILGIRFIVLHPGSAVGLTKEEAIKNIVDGLNLVSRESNFCTILLETMAGKGTECASTLEEVSAMLNGLEKQEQFGVCIDTCHLNDAGYDMSHFDQFLEEFDEKIGLEKIKCVHVNDSKNQFGAHKDRHENIGFGTIGFENLLNIIYLDTLKNVPKILETPFIGEYDTDKERLYPPYRFEIEMIHKREFNPNLYEDIRNFYKNDL